MIKKLFTFLIVVIVGACILMLRQVRQVMFMVEDQTYIAHAGGAIDGHKYTNSHEAVLHSLDKGLSFIECDLALTSDSVLVAAHDWLDFNLNTTGDTSYVAPTFADFKSRLIYGKYTPMSAQELLQIMQDNPHMYLVTNKLSDYNIIDQYFSTVKDRMCVTCFSVEDYNQLAHRGYFLPMMMSLPTEKQLCEIEWRSLIDREFVSPSVFVTFDKAYAEMRDSYSLKRLWYKMRFAKYALYTFTVCDKEEADSLFAANHDVRFVYVDDVEDF